MVTFLATVLVIRSDQLHVREMTALIVYISGLDATLVRTSRPEAVRVLRLMLNSTRPRRAHDPCSEAT